MFDQAETSKIFFNNIVADALVGVRPAITEFGSKNADSGTAAGGLADASTGNNSDAWATLVDASVLEDEVKAEQQKLARLVTTPIIFQTKFGEINQSFEVLSTLFAIIAQYDGDVRWAKQAPTAQLLFQQAAVSSRTGSVTGFRLCKNRTIDLQELVRGGSVNTTDPVSKSISWTDAAHRTPLMLRLELADDTAKQLTSNEKVFKSSSEQIYHEANIIAAMARVILEREMPDADDEGYAEFARQMQSAATDLKSSVKLADFEKAAAASNAVGQSCDDCHAQWR